MSKFEFMGNEYEFLKPVNPPKSPVNSKPEIHGNGTHHSLWEYFDSKKLAEDLNSELVLDTFKISLDGMYGRYTKDDAEILSKILDIRGEANKWMGVDKRDVLKWMFYDLNELGLPYTPEVMRTYIIGSTSMFWRISYSDTSPKLPSDAIKGKSIDCDGTDLFEYSMLYHLNKLMGINAKYFELSIFPSDKDGNVYGVGHVDLLVYYPDTGKWEIYSQWAVTNYFYIYSDGINSSAYKRYLYTKEARVKYITSVQNFEYYLGTSESIFAVDGGTKVYVPAGMIQFDSLDEALFWYIYSDFKHHSGGLFYWFKHGYDGKSPDAFNEFGNLYVVISLMELPTPEDPYIHNVILRKNVTALTGGEEYITYTVPLGNGEVETFKVKAEDVYGWWEVVSYNMLKEKLAKEGRLQKVMSINPFIEKKNPPEFIKNPKPVFSEYYAPGWIIARIEEYKKGGGYVGTYYSDDGSLIDLIVSGFKNLFGMIRLRRIG
ncbi:hypothetical protein A3L02_02785 [Thermococcus celer Vu 13 = JCM 8558]|uniref:Uncharacterized protein n=1 Tax=Thermococcus celer Vu 13 = JCM 8558 TaxID=1293037 RepID=A0A218P0V6_THECE|nr:hypothetical protein A3L02_02785 [Thermococcus celer Vu 13 = JCM 8558]